MSRSATLDRPLRREPSWPLVALVAWLGLAALSALQSSLRDPDRSWDHLMTGALLAWLPWLVFSIPIVRLSRREAAWSRLVGLHLALAATTTLLYLGYLALFRSLPLPMTVDGWPQSLRDVFGEHLVGALLAYGLIATAGFATRGRPRAARPAATPVRGIAIRRHGRTTVVPAREIDWIEAEGSYARLHLGDSSELVRRSLTRLSDELEPSGFARVHRSAMVNVARVRAVESTGHGDGSVVLEDGTRVRVSRTFRAEFERALPAP